MDVSFLQCLYILIDEPVRADSLELIDSYCLLLSNNDQVPENLIASSKFKSNIEELCNRIQNVY